MLDCFCGSDGSKFLEAVKAGDVPTITECIKRKPKLVRAQQWAGGQTAWHLAARDGHAEVIRAMANTIRTLPSQQLHFLARFGSSPDEIIQNLAQSEDTKCLTPLHLACIKGHADAAGLLMSCGVNPFAMDSVGRTALHYAASWGHAECINAVLSVHSGPPKPEWGIVWPNDEETRLVDIRNTAGFTPLHYAVWVGRTEAIQALASYDASLKVVNVSNDYDWIKVGSGNTPLHLAAFGGDFDVVKLLLAAHVQTLSAGAEVMAASHGQWGERHADDVRPMRNRRGLMAYHIAVHKNYQHLTELLHPDIPYTFIFSNDDMDVGSVRMFGPARLMVIAAKALQQKLVTELAAVEAAAQSSSPGKATSEAHLYAASVVVLAAGDSGASVSGATAAVANDSSQMQQEQQTCTAPAAAVPYSASADAADAPAAASLGRLTPLNVAAVEQQEQEQPLRLTGPELLSPFAAKSQKRWNSTSTGLDQISLASNTPANSLEAAAVAAPGGPPVAVGQTTSLVSDADQSLTSAVAAATAVEPASIKCSFVHGLEDVTSSSAAAVAAAACGGTGSRGLGKEQDSFMGFNLSTVDQQQHQLQQLQQQAGGVGLPLAASGTGSAAMQQQQYSSTLPGRSTADEATLEGASVSSAVRSAALMDRTAAGVQSSAAVDNAANAAIDGGSTSIPTCVAAPVQVSVTAGGGSPIGMAAEKQRHRTVLSVGDSVSERDAVVRQQSLKGNSRRATAEQPESVRSWLQLMPMGSLRKLSSRREIADDLLPPSVIVTAATDDDSPTAQQQRRRQQQAGQLSRFSASGAAARRSGSMRKSQDRVSLASADSQVQLQQQSGSTSQRQVSNATDDLAAVLQRYRRTSGASDDLAAEQQRNSCCASRSTLHDSPQRLATVASVEDNPLDVMLANRATAIGESPEAMHQQLVLMKLASGMLNFQTAASAFNAASLQGLSEPGVNARTGSVTLAALRPAIATVPGSTYCIQPVAGDCVTGQRAASVPLDQELVLAAAAGTTDAGSTTVAHFANEKVGVTALHPVVASLAAGECRNSSGTAGPVTQARRTAQLLSKQGSMSNVRNESLRLLISKQASLKRMLSGSSRNQLNVKHTEEQLQSAMADATGASAPAGAAESLLGSGHLTVSTAVTTKGDLPVIQKRHSGLRRSGMITEESEGSSSTGDDDVCEICFDAAAVVQLQGCGHTLCVGCCKEMCKLHHFKPALCPYCRQIIHGFGVGK